MSNLDLNDISVQYSFFYVFRSVGIRANISVRNINIFIEVIPHGFATIIIHTNNTDQLDLRVPDLGIPEYTHSDFLFDDSDYHYNSD